MLLLYMEFRIHSVSFVSVNCHCLGVLVCLFALVQCVYVCVFIFRTRNQTLGLEKQSTIELHPSPIIVILTVLNLNVQGHRLLSHWFGLSGFLSAVSQVLCFVRCIPLLFLMVAFSRIVFSSVLVYRQMTVQGHAMILFPEIFLSFFLHS